ncbi:HIT family protein [Marinomonas piezotolerans]|uniref:HIT family protein n=1 Tax=Marinomonas piezotolerans TaxID=2213058 RepID=A0A370U5B7_9GAMM|nr:HIT domain-containing protein [Marinomonas piezotolerans]RDL42976.1 HIT family protein [Marinomonas piezotolerans]
MFELDPVLERDSIYVGDFSLCQLRLINNALAPWFILVPKRSGIEEIHHLQPADQMQLMAESCQLAETIQDVFAPDKLNVAAIGNKVRQLHLHHVARNEGDDCWPEPVWGRIQVQTYENSELARILLQVRGLLADDLTF